jgi:ATP-dependent DNA helicase DinG
MPGTAQKISSYLSPDAIAYMQKCITEAKGNEVFFRGKLNDEKIVESAQVLARGNREMVPAIMQAISPGDVVIHNHPSGGLEPSNADLSVASQLGNKSVGFYIINNSASQIYVAVEPFAKKTTTLLQPAALRQALSAGGPISKTLEAFEERQPQIEMLDHVARAFNENKVAAIEAGTGTGKTLAYLLPAIEWSVNNRERTVISTHTINLQEQLVFKDIPLLQNALSTKFKAVLVKGRSNYACLRKLSEADKQTDMFADSEQQSELRNLIEWSNKTKDGSKSDLSFMPRPEVWEKIQSESDTTLRAACPFYHRCFFYNARREAADADLLVVNHHLLFADLAVRSVAGASSEVAVLPPYKRLILDEAHNIEDVASSYFGVAVSYYGIRRILSKLLRRRGDKITGSLPFALSKLQSHAKKIPRELIDQMRTHIEMSTEKKVELLEVQLSEMMERLFYWTSAHRKDSFAEFKLRITPAIRRERGWQEIVVTEAPKLIAAMRALSADLSQVDKHLDRLEEFIGAEAASLAVDLRAQSGRLVEAASGVEQVLLKDDEINVRWLEVREGNYGNIVRLYTAPLEVAPILKKAVYDNFPTVVMTSATLTVAHDFAFLRRRLGIDLVKARRLDCVQLDSPFDFERQALIAIATDMPEPNAADFAEALSGKLLEALRLSNGRALVLFTAYGLLNRMHEELAPELAQLGIAAYKQGIENRTRLIEKFRADVNSVLFATESFWQGVDVQGEALQAVIFPRLPFKVPSEPMLEARVEAIDRNGGNSFMEYSVPQAVIKFKQGFGRLIRSKSDFGAVVIFDRRVVSKFYGRLFLQSLPKCRVVTGLSQEVFFEMEGFLRASARQSPVLT